MTTNFGDILVNQKNMDSIYVLSEMAQSLSVGEKYAYNPIVISGVSGTGKTHLVQLMQNILGDKAYYIHARELFDILNNKKSSHSLTKLLQSKACLIVDDVQYLSQDILVQEEMSYLMDFCLERGINILLSLKDSSEYHLSESLESRIFMGIHLQLIEPDLDIRTRYATQQLRHFGLNVNKEYALAIARRCTKFRSIRSTAMNIQSFFNRVGQIPELIDLDNFLTHSGTNPHLNSEIIISLVAKRYGFSSKDLKSKGRSSRLVEARQIAMYLCRQLLGEGFISIGKSFDGKDHSTVIHAFNKIEELKVRNKDMNMLITDLIQTITKNSLS